MPYLLECVIGTLAAVGFICILKGVYDIIMTSYARTGQPATLTRRESAMPYLLECVIGTLAAVGFICILKGVYDIIMTSYARTGQPATLYLSGDGASPDCEHLLLAAEQARRLYLPGMEIVFLELTLGGRWTTHPSYGDQFSAESFERRLPETARGIADYLGSGLIKGIGPRLAVKIAEKFGEETFDVLQNDPAQLTEIRGITPKKARDIGRQFTEMSEMRLLMDFLTENRCAAKRSGTAHRDPRDHPEKGARHWQTVYRDE